MIMSAVSLLCCSLLQNPVTRIKHYRLYVVHILPGLKNLDYQRVKPKERANALLMFGGESGKQMQAELVKKSTL